tara:strand:+ start:4037 stop:4273 length:237 start_codon:yes stop_codon:yes gene_type:complete
MKYKQSEMVSLSEYYSKAHTTSVKCRQISEMALEDRVEVHYPRTWLDKLDFIDKVHEGGALSDTEIIAKVMEDNKSKK